MATKVDFRLIASSIRPPDTASLSQGGVDLDGGDPFEFEPVPLSVFLTDSGYMNLPMLSEEQRRVVEVATDIYPLRIRTLLGYPYLDPTKLISVIVALWGKGSGKDFVSRVSICRAVYLLMCLRSPQKTYGMTEADSIDTINMAYSANQAASIFFVPLTRMIDKAPWFRNKYLKRTKDIVFEKGIWAHSGNSATESFEGFNPILSVLDEIDAFRTTEDLARHGGTNPEHAASGIFNALRSSGQSRFPGLAKTLLLSYPRRPNGFIFQQYKYAVTDANTFASFGATWEVNPTKTREDFNDEFRRDPEGSSMRYACIPTVTRQNFIRDRDALYDVFHYDITTSSLRIGAPVNPYHEDGFTPAYRIRVQDARDRFLHCDIGVTRDSAAVAAVHLHGWITQYGTLVPVVMVDFLACMSPVASGAEITIESVRGIVRAFRKVRQGGVRIGMVSFDQFQSKDSIQILAAEGLVTGQRSVDRNDEAYNLLKELVYTRRLLSPGSIQMVEELRDLIRIGGKVDHQPGGAKDLSDALAGAVADLFDALYPDDAVGKVAFSMPDVQRIDDLPRSIVGEGGMLISPEY